MKRVAVLVVLTMFVGGCPGLTGLSDPPSNAPDLAGRWAMKGQDGRDAGCLVADETGDPVSLTGNSLVFKALETDTIFFDGSVRTTPSGFEYAAIGQVTQTGTNISAEFEVEVFEVGLTVGMQRVMLTGAQVEEGMVVGSFESTQEGSFADIPPTLSEEGSAERDGCELDLFPL